MDQQTLSHAARKAFIGGYLGTLISLVFQGYVICLMITYLKTPASSSERSCILLCFAIGIFLSGIDMYLVFEMGITHFADVSYLTARKWPEGFTCLGGGVVESISQWFFAMRLLKLSETNRFVSAALLGSIVLGLGPHIGLGIELIRVNRTDQIKFANLMTPWNYTHYAVGTAITMSICIPTAIVLHRKSRGTTARTVQAMHKLSFYFVHAMILPTILATSALIIKAAMPTSSAHVIPNYMSSKVSLMCLLQMLLVRDQVRADMKPTADGINLQDFSSLPSSIPSMSGSFHFTEKPTGTAGHRKGTSDYSRSETASSDGYGSGFAV